MPQITNATVLAVQALLNEMARKYTSARNKLYLKLVELNATNIASNDTLFYLISRMDSIETGITPTGSVTYDTNGTYDVTNKATVVINVPQNDTSELPTLNAPSISRNGDTITVINPSSNGNFNKNIKLYSNGQLVQSKSFSTQGGSTTFSIRTFPVGDYVIVAKCSNQTNFKDSANSSGSITCSCFSITNTLTQGVTNNSATTIADGISYTEIITPNGGWWLPEFITITQDGITLEEGTDYTWDMYSGVVGLIANGDLVLTITCESTPKLKTPVINSFNEDTRVIDVDYVKYAMSYSYIIDGTTVATYTITDLDTEAVLANQLTTPTISLSNSILTINESTACYGLTVDLYIDSIYKENIVIGDNI